MRRLKVVYLPHPTPLPGRQEENLIDAISEGNDVTIYDRDGGTPGSMEGREVVVDMGGHSTTEFIDEAVAAGVKYVQLQTTGLDHVLIDHLKATGMIVANCPGYLSSVSLAESAMMFILMLAHRFSEARLHFDQRRMNEAFGFNLEGRALGVLGLGASGKELAKRARAFAMRIMAIDVRPIEPRVRDEIGLDFVGTPDDLDQLVSECDFLSLHVPLHGPTRHIIDRHRIDMMKPTACLINVARGALVDEKALYGALMEGRIGGAGLDVFAQEPADPTRPVYGLPNVLVMPHCAASTIDMARNRARFAAENLARFARGLDPESLV